jgi:hypothetical protein
MVYHLKKIWVKVSTTSAQPNDVQIGPRDLDENIALRYKLQEQLADREIVVRMLQEKMLEGAALSSGSLTPMNHHVSHPAPASHTSYPEEQ